MTRRRQRENDDVSNDGEMPRKKRRLTHKKKEGTAEEVFWCAACNQQRSGFAREASPDDLAKFGKLSCRGGPMCTGCAWNLEVVEKSARLCVPCKKMNKTNKWTVLTGEMKHYLDIPLDSPLEKCCERCVARAKRRKEEFERTHPSVEIQTDPGLASSTKQCSIVESKEAQTESDGDVMGRFLRKGILALAAEPLPKPAFEDLDDYLNHVDRVTDGLADCLLKAVSRGEGAPRSISVRAAVAMCLEMLAHQLRPQYCATQMLVADWLAVGRCSDQIRRVLAKIGVACDPTTQRRRLRRKVDSAMEESPFTMIAREEGHAAVAVVDDFHFESGRSLMPTSRGVCFRDAACATSIVKDVVLEGGRLRKVVSDDTGRAVSHQSPNVVEDLGLRAALSVEEEMRCGRTYFSARPVIRHSKFTPYRGDHIPSGQSPVSLRNVHLVSFRQADLRSNSGLESEFRLVLERSKVYLREDAAMLLVGDWRIYRGAKGKVTSCFEEFGGLVPIPGPLHIAINLQLGTLMSFASVFGDLWSAAFPKSDRMVAESLRKAPPMRRVGILQIAEVAWRSVREDVIESGRGRNVPTEWWILTNLFDWFIPLSLDFYGAFLDGDIGVYKSLMASAWRAFVHLGKTNYTRATILLLSDLDYWQKHRPDIYRAVELTLPQLSEEEIEVYHSVVRRWIRAGETCDKFAERFRGVSAVSMSAVPLASKLLGGDRKGKGSATMCRCVKDAEAVERMGRKIRELFSAALSDDSGAEIGEETIVSRALKTTFKRRLLPCCLWREAPPVSAVSVEHSVPEMQKQGACPGCDACSGASCTRCRDIYLHEAQGLAERVRGELRHCM